MARRIQHYKFEDKRIEGIEPFRKKLGRSFFADVDVRLVNVKTGKPELVIDFHCNYSLTHCLYHFRNGSWGNFDQNLYGITGINELALQLGNLQRKNPFEIDIAELSLHFTDTSLFVSKIPNNSIAEQFGKIISAVSGNFVHFTKHMTEMPYEIFVPVFTEFSMMPHANVLYRYGGHLRQPMGFFEYWALYFHSNEEGEAAIYDLKNREITEGDFLLLP